jgi:indolepyruvate ferredoxin oxidoreductase
MNAPFSASARRAIEDVSLDDKYSLESGYVFMSGVQALVRLPMLQRRRDSLAGRNTAGFISGYRGSPLGTYDQALLQAKEHLARHHIVFRPGINEELAVTSVWGSQQLEFEPSAKKYDGVFGIWYGKGPGVDRSLDALKHANLSGTAPLGGVVAVAADDHVSKSSTLAHQSDQTFIAAGIPVFFPANVQEILDFGLHGIALSRYSGLWAGLKTIQEVVEAGTPVCVDAGRVSIALPEDFILPADGLQIRWPDEPLAQEARMMEAKWPAALAYIRANKLNRSVIEGRDDRLGIVATGKAFSDTRQALADLGLDDATCRAIGLRLYKVGVVWPLEPEGVRAFAEGLQEILVVEEKRGIIEQQLKDELYHFGSARPRIVGKHDDRQGGYFGGEWSHARPGEDWLLRAKADLTPAIIARAVAARLTRLGVPPDVAARMRARLEEIDAVEQALASLDNRGATRTPWFCPGCPHNTSTRVPEGSKALAGIGCHGMVVWMDRSTTSWSQMGGEGAPWVGQAPFTTRTHMFANLGDGTYSHSGFLAIRHAITSGANMTYKILFNSAVAMTGGQRVDQPLDVPSMARELLAEGVKRIVVVADDLAKHSSDSLPPGVTLRQRDELDAVQRELREEQGVSILIYDQVCATKRRRDRKRGVVADPAKRVIINELVCEGCGDCGVESNCLAVQPVETTFGRKRQINQSTCNKDFSCTKGMCPSFVTVEGGTLRKPAAPERGKPSELPPIPEPARAKDGSTARIIVAGIGGTGVVTIGQILGMAAHLDGKAVITQDATGMAQMGGATWSHIQIADDQDSLHAPRVNAASADLVIACDAVVAANKTTLATLSRERSFVVLNSHATPTAASIAAPDEPADSGATIARIERLVQAGAVEAFDAEEAATRAMGHSIYSNQLMLGYAWQKGRIPLSHDALMRAIELNAVQVENNKAAFEWGRRMAHDPAALRAEAGTANTVTFVKKPRLDDLIAERIRFLTGYQNRRYAEDYQRFVEKVRAAEAGLSGSKLTEAVARYLFKLMAYKDEYEVARLHTSPEFLASIAAQFEGDYRLVHHLAPPTMSKTDARGRLVKRSFGPWVRTAFRVLARLKPLRGTTFDPFGRTEERRTERALVAEYRACIDELLRGLSADNRAAAVAIASLPEGIRGYGDVKARHLAAVRQKWAALMQEWRDGAAGRKAAA